MTSADASNASEMNQFRSLPWRERAKIALDGHFLSFLSPRNILELIAHEPSARIRKRLFNHLRLHRAADNEVEELLYARYKLLINSEPWVNESGALVQEVANTLNRLTTAENFNDIQCLDWNLPFEGDGVRGKYRQFIARKHKMDRQKLKELFPQDVARYGHFIPPPPFVIAPRASIKKIITKKYHCDTVISSRCDPVGALEWFKTRLKGHVLNRTDRVAIFYTLKYFDIFRLQFIGMKGKGRKPFAELYQLTFGFIQELFKMYQNVSDQELRRAFERRLPQEDVIDELSLASLESNFLKTLPPHDYKPLDILYELAVWMKLEFCDDYRVRQFKKDIRRRIVESFRRLVLAAGSERSYCTAKDSDPAFIPVWSPPADQRDPMMALCWEDLFREVIKNYDTSDWYLNTLGNCFYLNFTNEQQQVLAPVFRKPPAEVSKSVEDLIAFNVRVRELGSSESVTKILTVDTLGALQRTHSSTFGRYLVQARLPRRLFSWGGVTISASMLESIECPILRHLLAVEAYNQIENAIHTEKLPAVASFLAPFFIEIPGRGKILAQPPPIGDVIYAEEAMRSCIQVSESNDRIPGYKAIFTFIRRWLTDEPALAENVMLHYVKQAEENSLGTNELIEKLPWSLPLPKIEPPKRIVRMCSKLFCYALNHVIQDQDPVVSQFSDELSSLMNCHSVCLMRMNLLDDNNMMLTLKNFIYKRSTAPDITDETRNHVREILNWLVTSRPSVIDTWDQQVLDSLQFSLSNANIDFVSIFTRGGDIQKELKVHRNRFYLDYMLWVKERLNKDGRPSTCCTQTILTDHQAKLAEYSSLVKEDAERMQDGDLSSSRVEAEPVEMQDAKSEENAMDENLQNEDEEDAESDSKEEDDKPSSEAQSMDDGETHGGSDSVEEVRAPTGPGLGFSSIKDVQRFLAAAAATDNADEDPKNAETDNAKQPSKPQGPNIYDYASNFNVDFPHQKLRTIEFLDVCMDFVRDTEYKWDLLSFSQQDLLLTWIIDITTSLRRFVIDPSEKLGYKLVPPPTNSEIQADHEGAISELIVFTFDNVEHSLRAPPALAEVFRTVEARLVKCTQRHNCWLIYSSLRHHVQTNASADLRYAIIRFRWPLELFDPRSDTPLDPADWTTNHIKQGYTLSYYEPLGDTKTLLLGFLPASADKRRLGCTKFSIDFIRKCDFEIQCRDEFTSAMGEVMSSASGKEHIPTDIQRRYGLMFLLRYSRQDREWDGDVKDRIIEIPDNLTRQASGWEHIDFNMLHYAGMTKELPVRPPCGEFLSSKERSNESLHLGDLQHVDASGFTEHELMWFLSKYPFACSVCDADDEPVSREWMFSRKWRQQPLLVRHYSILEDQQKPSPREFGQLKRFVTNNMGTNVCLHHDPTTDFLVDTNYHRLYSEFAIHMTRYGMMNLPENVDSRVVWIRRDWFRSRPDARELYQQLLVASAKTNSEVDPLNISLKFGETDELAKELLQTGPTKKLGYTRSRPPEVENADKAQERKDRHRITYYRSCGIFGGRGKISSLSQENTKITDPTPVTDLQTTTIDLQTCKLLIDDRVASVYSVTKRRTVRLWQLWFSEGKIDNLLDLLESSPRSGLQPLPTVSKKPTARSRDICLIALTRSLYWPGSEDDLVRIWVAALSQARVDLDYLKFVRPLEAFSSIRIWEIVSRLQESVIISFFPSLQSARNFMKPLEGNDREHIHKQLETLCEKCDRQVLGDERFDSLSRYAKTPPKDDKLSIGLLDSLPKNPILEYKSYTPDNTKEYHVSLNRLLTFIKISMNRGNGFGWYSHSDQSLEPNVKLELMQLEHSFASSVTTDGLEELCSPFVYFKWYWQLPPEHQRIRNYLMMERSLILAVAQSENPSRLEKLKQTRSLIARGYVKQKVEPSSFLNPTTS